MRKFFLHVTNYIHIYVHMYVVEGYFPTEYIPTSGGWFGTITSNFNVREWEVIEPRPTHSPGRGPSPQFSTSHKD